jgi:polyhydroxybutyrate depolymerase
MLSPARILPLALSVVIAQPGLRPVAAQSAPAEQSRTLRVAGVTRSYLLKVPSSVQAGHTVPLVLVFHGAGGTPRQMARHTGFSALAEREGFVVVYPAGIRRRWNDGRGLVSQDDVGFVRALLDTLERDLSIDPHRVYATGISNGAMFSYRLACDLPGVLAGIAPVAGAMPSALAERCTQAPPVALAAFQGSADPLVPYDGGRVAWRRGTVLPAVASVELWAREAGCSNPPAVTMEPDRVTDGTQVKLSTWSGCRDGRDVQLYTIEGGGHTWPGDAAARGLLGRVTRDLDATSTIWSFFSTHPKP